MLLISVIIYLIITVIIGVASSRLIRNAEDYMSASRKIPYLLNTAALFALWFGSETVFGASSEFVEHGLIGVIEDPFGGVLCLLLYAFVFVKPLYRMKLHTLGDLFRRHYGARIEVVSSFFMIITFFGYIAAQLVALGILMNLISGLSLVYCILISAFVVTFYTMVGGMWAISITDFVQSVIIISGLVAISWSVTNAAGGGKYILEHAPEYTFQFLPEADVSGWIHWVSAWMVLGLGSIPSQDIFQRMNAARSERVAMASTLSGALIYLLFSMLPLYLALAARVLYAREIEGMDTQHVLPVVALKHSNIYVQVLFFGALLSAIFSTCSGAILAPASIISENIIRPYLGKDLDDKKFLRILRFSVMLIAMIATLMALSSNNIYELVAESSILGLVTLLVPMFCAIYWKPASSFGALLSMIAGFTVWFIFEYVFEIDFPSLMAGFIASVAGMVSGSLYRKSLKKNYPHVHNKPT